VIGEVSTSPSSSLLTRPKDQYTSTLLATTICLAMRMRDYAEVLDTSGVGKRAISG
jgi:hypothetical protein